MKYEIYVRDLTTDSDMRIWLPTDEANFNNVFNSNHEYIIIDHGNELKPDELSNIKELNDFLLFCKSEGIDLETLRILSTTYFYEEVLEKVGSSEYIILDVDSEADWAIYREERWGRYMYEQGFNDLPCEVPEELMDYIDWEANWTSMECSGWRVVSVDHHDYIVR